MAFTIINFNQIQDANETPDSININKNINFTEQVSIPLIPPSQDLDSVLWVEPNTGTFKSRINLVNYSNSFKGEFKSIAFGSPDTLSLGGNTGIINDLVVSGASTVLNIRSNTFGIAQWSILEIKGNLTIASGCTVNLIRTPLIVRGNILGSGIITSPDGVNGGLGGTGGPGGSGGPGGPGALAGGSFGNEIIGNQFGFPVSPGISGGNAPTLGSPGWTNGLSGSGSITSNEYGISAGNGGNGGRGTGGGGGAGGTGYSTAMNPFGIWTIRYTSSGNAGSSGSGSNQVFTGGLPGGNFGFIPIGSGGGGAGGVGQNGAYSDGSSTGAGGPGAYGNNGETGVSAGTLSIPYIGISTPSPAGTSPSQGTPGGATFGGAGGVGAPISNFSTGQWPQSPNGSPGGTGGNGGAGGGTGGAHISIYCAGTISSPITIRPGKGGLTGGSTSLPRAQTGSVWLFTLNNTDPITTDLTGATGTPNGPVGILTRTLTSNSSGVTDFFTNILFEPNGITPAKNKIALTT